MTPAVPLLVGWYCVAGLLMVFAASRWNRHAALVALLVVLSALAGLVFDTPWQMLALGVLILAAAAAVGAGLAQADADRGQLARPPNGNGLPAATQTGMRLIAWSWLLAGLFSAAIGLLQFFQATAWLGGLVNHAPVGQVYGNLRQRNQLATLMALALWALWYLWQHGGLQSAWAGLADAGANAAGKAADVLAWLLMLPLATVLALTLSRTGMLQLLTLALLLVWWTWGFQRENRKRLFAWLAGLIAVYAFASLVLPHWAGMTDLWLRLEGQGSRACISRKVLWGNVLHLIAQKPWLGWGWGNLEYAHYYANYPGMRFCELLDNAHNLPLHLAVELGMPLALAFCGAVLWWVWRSAPWREPMPQRQLMWGALAMIGLHSLLEYPLWYAPFQLACGLALGVLWATAPPSPGKLAAGAVPATFMLAAQRVLATLMLAGLAYASFDYVRVTQLYTQPFERLAPFQHNTLAQAERTPLYRNAVNFARLGMTQPTPANAPEQLALAQGLMHYSAEARVVERVIESLRLLGRDAEARAEAAHFRAVYPREYTHWLARTGQGAATAANGAASGGAGTGPE